ncbi:DUF887-domain-containing protein [Dacryopinax primogenitus]|uniref:DUF887-domain-containing protein n=1 Tax=Dacryopinax primogenitus (strain DJM 731) TaxID=1858805 RepID=M5GES3_DACPD|nr:DUF887-domain-containing protein [Dacryopinax primogenitus]EJU05642.1 DUF887-domain-containing protein [Dacryopinax primogenitus]
MAWPPSATLMDKFADWAGSTLHLPYLPAYVPVILRAFIAFNFSNILSSMLSPYVSKTYATLPKKTRHAWDVRFTSLVHAILVVYLAWRTMDKPALVQDRAFGWDPESGTMASIAVACFLWDVIESVTNFENIGFLLHACSCLGIFLCTFRPFLNYYAARFLLWETSTIFLNIHWWLDKTGQTGTTFQLVNGVILMTAFFCVRLMFGGYQSTQFWHTMGEIRDKVPMPLLILYTVGNVFLQGLNWYWFYKMIAALRKRFVPANVIEQKTK